MSRELYVPVALVDALGWATISRFEFEFVVNIFVAVLSTQALNRVPCDAREPLENKLQYLVSLERSRLLKHVWWRRLRSLMMRADKVNDEYCSAALGVMYIRGSGYLEELIRPIAARAKIAPASPGMTPSKVKGIADRFRLLAVEASELAGLVVGAAEEMASKT